MCYPAPEERWQGGGPEGEQVLVPPLDWTRMDTQAWEQDVGLGRVLRRGDVREGLRGREARERPSPLWRRRTHRRGTAHVGPTERQARDGVGPATGREGREGPRVGLWAGEAEDQRLGGMVLEAWPHVAFWGTLGQLPWATARAEGIHGGGWEPEGNHEDSIAVNELEVPGGRGASASTEQLLRRWTSGGARGFARQPMTHSRLALLLTLLICSAVLLGLSAYACYNCRLSLLDLKDRKAEIAALLDDENRRRGWRIQSGLTDKHWYSSLPVDA